MNEEELEALAAATPNIPPPPPATPPPPPVSTGRVLGSVNELIETMTAIDKARMQFFEAEQKKMQLLEDNIARRLEEKFSSQFSNQHLSESTGMDPIIVEGAKILMSAWMSNVPRPVAPQPVAQPIATPTAEKKEEAKTEVPMTTYTQEQIDGMADKIFEHYPKDVRAFKMGLLSKEDAIKKIMMAGLSYNDAERVATALLETEYPDDTEAKA